MITLTTEEARVLGCLIEKQITTPEYYPLTLNALAAACNQKNNRDPVVSFSEDLISLALDGLREKRLASLVSAAGSRVPKYRHNAPDVIGLDDKDLAVLCELLVRGPQTPGELRNRCERMVKLVDVAEVDKVLEGLATRPQGPLVTKLARQPGQKEARFAHLLSGPVAAEAVTAPESAPAVLATGSAPSLLDRLGKLELEVQMLRNEMQAMQAKLAPLIGDAQ